MRPDLMAAPAALRRRWWLWLVAWLLATGLLVVFARSLDLAAAGRLAARAEVGWLALAIAANFVALPLMMEQWWRLLPLGRRPPRAAIWECVTLSVATMNTVPLGGGHALAVGLLATRAKVGLTGALSLLALQQLSIGIAKLGLLLLALSVAPLPAGYATAAWWLAAGLAVATLALFGLVRSGRSVIGEWLAGWVHHFESFRRPQTFVGAVALALGAKVAMGVAIFAVQRSLGVELPVSAAVCVLAAVTFGTMISVTPANLFVYEAAALAAYRWLGVPTEQALALGLLQHVCFLVPMVGAGYGLMLWRLVRPAGPVR